MNRSACRGDSVLVTQTASAIAAVTAAVSKQLSIASHSPLTRIEHLTPPHTTTNTNCTNTNFTNAATSALNSTHAADASKLLAAACALQLVAQPLILHEQLANVRVGHAA